MAEKYTDEIIKIEWDMFDKVNNEGGRASCQDDWRTFYIMRSAQFDAWNEAMRESYLADLNNALASDRNLLTEKYAYMTGYKYMGETDNLENKQQLIMIVMEQMLADTIAMREKYPKISAASRPYGTSDGGMVSVDTYLMCEIMTYSAATLEQFALYLVELKEQGKSLPMMILENTVEQLGYENLDAAEERYGRAGF